MTDITGLEKNAPITWTNEIDESFKKMKSLMAADALAAYHDHNKKYNIFTDASDFQLGSCGIIVTEMMIVCWRAQLCSHA